MSFSQCALSNALKIPLHLLNRAVLDTNAKLDKDGIVVKKGFLGATAGQQLYNLLQHSHFKVC